MDYVIGVDGGGTASSASLVALDGTVLAQSRGGPANYLLSGVGRIADVVGELIAQVKLAAGVERHVPRSICLSLAGAGRPRARRAVLGAIERRIPAQDIIITGDGVAALVGAFPGGAGIALIAGTGVLAMGVDEQGRSARAGGWGHLLGDEGSGFDLGRRTVLAALASENQSGDPTILAAKIEARLGLTSVDALVDWVYTEREASVRRLASLAPLVFEAAEEGDVIAAGILDHGGRALATLVDRVARQLHLDSMVVPLSPFGGLFEESYLLLERVVTQASIEIEIVPARFPPSLGACLIALRRAEVELDLDFLTRLDRSESEWRSRVH